MIRRLSPELIREIAAGEVIGAPVDIVKELLENALDAGASRLQLELHDGGIRKIVLQDNGAGIAEDELELALQPHSTSKLQDISQVHAIASLGFRGEGLHAIRYAARLRIASRPQQQLGGAIVEADGEAITVQKGQPLPAGTTVTVQDVFARLPARHAALESPVQEGKRISALLYRYALHHPQVGIRFLWDDELKLVHAVGNEAGLLELIKQLWGVVTANRLLKLEYHQGDYQLEGWLSRPELSRPRRDRLHLAINGRPVQWPAPLLQQLLKSYAELLPSGHFPVGVINLRMPVAEVLVNTSPDKSQVRLLEPSTLENLFSAAMGQLFHDHPLSRSLPEFRQADALEPTPQHGFPALRYLGNYQQLYLLAEGEQKLWVIDQHAAHERIIFEELRRRYQQEAPIQLEQAEIIQLNAHEMSQLQARQAELAQKGLLVEAFGAHSYAIRSVPALLIGFPQLLEDILRSSLQKHSLEQAWRDILARLACLPAIKAGYKLSVADAQGLLDGLAQCETPWSCPHGRPTALVLSELELARRFGRRAPRAVAATSSTPSNSSLPSPSSAPFVSKEG